ncbi:MAG: hypothetical protein IT308_11965 [Anaerolineaceae bacterium]|nr:hypothetical protein [Anaerolineaceae bacterium]
MGQEIWIVAICLIALVILVNLGLFAALRSHGISNQYEPLVRALKRARSPWQEEEKQINELAKRVADLHSTAPPEELKKESPDTG